jgi:hypothetical protein
MAAGTQECKADAALLHGTTLSDRVRITTVQSRTKE